MALSSTSGNNGHNFGPTHRNFYNQEEIDDALSALIGHAGNAAKAIEYLESEGKRAPCASTLLKWARITHWERHEELRELVAGRREDQLANDLLDLTARATEGIALGIEKTIERLDSGKDEDPAKSTASLARVLQTGIEKRLTLQGRPTRITETIDVEARVRKLVAMGVLHLPDGETPALEPGDEE